MSRSHVPGGAVSVTTQGQTQVSDEEISAQAAAARPAYCGSAVMQLSSQNLFKASTPVPGWAVALIVLTFLLILLMVVAVAVVLAVQLRFAERLAKGNVGAAAVSPGTAVVEQ
jgi:hypothetical protein